MKNYLAKTSIKYFQFALAATLSVGCVGWRPVGELKEITDPLQASCSTSEGERSLSLYRNNEFQFSSLFSWRIEQSKISAEVYDAVGRTLAEIVIPDNGRKLHGAMTPKLPHVAIEAEGFVVIDNRNIGLKNSELSCILTGNLPPAWIRGPKATFVPGKSKFRFSDEKRTIVIDRVGSDWNNYCAAIRVPYFLILSFETLKICQKKENKINTTMAHNDLRVDFLEVNGE